MLRTSSLVGATLALVLLLTNSASAQFRGLQIPPALQMMMLLRTPEVQKELNLTDEQNAALADLAMQMQSEALEIFSGLQDLSEEERKEELPNLMKTINEKGKELSKKVDKLMDEKQLKRMRELSLQKRDVAALGDDEVIAALKLTDAQKKQLADLHTQAESKQKEIVDELLSSGGDRQAVGGKIRALQKELGDKALGVLTAEQKKQFDAMKGPKFEFPPQRGFGF